MSGKLGKSPFARSGIVGKFSSVGFTDNSTQAGVDSIEIESAGTILVKKHGIGRAPGVQGAHMYGSNTDQNLTQFQITHVTSGQGNCGGRHHRFRWINGNTAIPHIKFNDGSTATSPGWSAGWNWSTSGTKVWGISTISGEQNELICSDFWTLVFNSSLTTFQGISNSGIPAADQHIIMYFEYNQAICVAPGSETFIDSSSNMKIAKAF